MDVVGKPLFMVVTLSSGQERRKTGDRDDCESMSVVHFFMTGGRFSPLT